MRLLKFHTTVYFWLSIAIIGSFVAICQSYPDGPHHFVTAILLAGLFTVITIKLMLSQQSLEHAKKNLDEAQQLAGIGSWERDLTSGNGFWSENHYRLFDLPPDSPVPDMEEFFMLIHPEDREEARNTVLSAIESGSCYEITYRRAGNGTEGRIFRSRGAVENDLDNRPVRIIGSVQDITERRRQERLSDQLLSQKELFITRLSHDLKTPLTPLMALLPLIRRESKDTGQRELIDLCINSVQYINSLIKKTTRLAELSSNLPGVLVTVPLAEILDSFLAGFVNVHPPSRCPSVNNVIPEGISIRVNPSELNEVFHNLLSNAVKFSPQGSMITIDALPDGDQVTIRVQDSGIGMTPEESEYVFDEFFKADKSRHELTSSGLGLSICRRIVENHGGRIWAESRGPDRGTTICFTLPMGGNHEQSIG